MDGKSLDCETASSEAILPASVGDFGFVNLNRRVIYRAIGIYAHFLANLSGIVGDRSGFYDLALLSPLTPSNAR